MFREVRLKMAVSEWKPADETVMEYNPYWNVS
jgi:hypothetical protein